MTTTSSAGRVQDAFPRRWRVDLLVFLEANARRIVLGAVLVGLVLSAGYAILLGDEVRYLDEQTYLDLARSLVGGHGFSLDGIQPTAYRPPGYPMMLAPLYAVTGGNVLAMRFVGVAAFAGSIWLTHRVGRRVSTEAAGVIAAVLVAVYPLFVYTATALYPQMPALFLLLLMVELGMQATAEVTGRRLLRAGGAGVAGGVLTLVVPSFGPSVVLFVLWICWQHRAARDLRRVARPLIVMVVAAAVLPVAWCVRNEIQMHAFVPVSTNNGINLLLGNNGNATPGGGRVNDIAAYESAASRLSEVEQDHRYTADAIGWIAAHPAQAVQLYAGKVLNNFSFRNELATSGQGSPVKDLVSALSFYPVLALALLRVLLARRRPLTSGEKLLLGFVAVNVLLLAIFFTRLRLRIPLDGLTIVLAASAVVVLLRARDRSHGPGVPA